VDLWYVVLDMMLQSSLFSGNMLDLLLAKEYGERYFPGRLLVVSHSFLVQ
jgi:hypothetical protein